MLTQTIPRQRHKVIASGENQFSLPLRKRKCAKYFKLESSLPRVKRWPCATSSQRSDNGKATRPAKCPHGFIPWDHKVFSVARRNRLRRDLLHPRREVEGDARHFHFMLTQTIPRQRRKVIASGRAWRRCGS